MWGEGRNEGKKVVGEREGEYLLKWDFLVLIFNTWKAPQGNQEWGINVSTRNCFHSVFTLCRGSCMLSAMHYGHKDCLLSCHISAAAAASYDYDSRALNSYRARIYIRTLVCKGLTPPQRSPNQDRCSACCLLLKKSSTWNPVIQ